MVDGTVRLRCNRSRLCACDLPLKQSATGKQANKRSVCRVRRHWRGGLTPVSLANDTAIPLHGSGAPTQYSMTPFPATTVSIGGFFARHSVGVPFILVHFC